MNKHLVISVTLDIWIGISYLDRQRAITKNTTTRKTYEQNNEEAKQANQINRQTESSGPQHKSPSRCPSERINTLATGLHGHAMYM